VKFANRTEWITPERWIQEQKYKHLNMALTGGLFNDSSSKRNNHQIQFVDFLSVPSVPWKPGHERKSRKEENRIKEVFGLPQ